jgi:hypothetical protein
VWWDGNGGISLNFFLLFLLLRFFSYFLFICNPSCLLATHVENDVIICSGVLV